MCFDSVHKRYMGGAAVWLVLVPFGVPAFFLWLLRRFKVPQMAALFTDNAWLREAIKLAWAEGLAQPPDAASLTVDSISTLHLEALFAFFMHDISAEDASDIMSGTRPPIALDVFGADAEDPEELSGQQPITNRLSRGLAAATRRLMKSLTFLSGAKPAVSRRILLIKSAAAKVADEDEAVARRALVLNSILAHLRNNDEVAVPPLVWERPMQAEEAALALCSPDATRVHTSGLRCSELPQLLDIALGEVSFLFAAYRMDCWYWCVLWLPVTQTPLLRRSALTHALPPCREVVELVRKLMLTSILALIAPGSAGQITVGLLIAFATLLATQILSPYAQRRLNHVGQAAQIHLFFLLLVALLLKARSAGPVPVPRPRARAVHSHAFLPRS